MTTMEWKVFTNCTVAGSLAHNWKVNPATIVRAIDKGHLNGIKIGSDWRFTAQQLDDYLEKRTVKNKPKKNIAV